MIFSISLRRSLAAAMVALLLPALPARADEVPDMQIAQGLPVWEPGDPLPGGAGDATAYDEPETEEPYMASEPATPEPAAPPRLPTKRPGAAPILPEPAVSIPASTVPDETMPAATPAAPPRKSEAEDPDDFLCTRAPLGKAAAVPVPFDRWLVRVCAPEGQALVPVLGEAWVAHGSADPVSILAMPPGGSPPPVAGAFDARYDIRFIGFQGGPATGERLAQATALLKAATGAGDKLPPHDETWQLDAISSVNEARYNIFFYLAGGAAAEGGRPGQIIVCLDQCRQALYLDVLRGAEAREALGD